MSAEDWTTKIRAAAREREADLVALTTELIGFDTTARDLGDPARDERALQEHLAQRLRAAGAEVELVTYGPGVPGSERQVPPALDFTDRPQLIARFRAAAAPEPDGARALVFNGHVDAVSCEPVEAWTSDPLAAVVRDGRLYGRGACDMKGGVAAMVVAAEVLAALDVPLAGELVVNTVTDEEYCGAGAAACVAAGLRADAAIIPEPTTLQTWTGCRGILSPTITVAGRPGHAEVAQPHWRDGGAVNAIDKMALVLEEVRALHADWQARPAHVHPLMSPPSIVTTMISGGEWWVSFPASCRATLDITYLPVQADADGFGTRVEAEVEAAVARACERDDWLAAHPPQVTWSVDLPPNEVAADTPVVASLARAAARCDRDEPRIATLDSWYDASNFTRIAGIPAVAFGPAGELDGRPIPHTIDECVPVADLVATAETLALAAVDFLGLVPSASPMQRAGSSH
jgi:acetylornithine deacetylase